MSSSSAVRSPLYPALERAAISAWSGELPFSQRALAEALAPELGLDPTRVAQALPTFLRRLERDGIYTGQRARYGAKTSGSGGLSSPQCFNWSDTPPHAATLRTIAGPFLADAGVATHRKHALRSALRLGLELPVKCSDDALLGGCESIPADALYSFPRRVYEAARSRPTPLSEQTALNHRSAIRGVMRYGATLRLIPIVFPQLWSDDPWSRDKDRFFPLAEKGATSNRIATMRSAWTAFADAFAAHHPELPNSLQSVTREIADEVIREMQVVKGRYAQGYAARTAFRYVAQTFGEGPYAEPSLLDGFTVATPSGPRPALFLRCADGGAATGDWEVFFGMLSEHGLPAELIEFIQWYREYVTASPIDILADPDRFPPRRQRLVLDQNTLSERIYAMRAFLGAALYELRPDPDSKAFGLSLDPATLTPSILFGNRFNAILAAMMAWWQARAAVMPDDALGKSMTGALRQMIIGLGMIALALYERLRHERLKEVATETTASGAERVNWMQEEDAPKTALERTVWDSYRQAGRLADALAGSAKGRKKGRRVKRNNDFKDIRRIVENTPPDYWIRILNHLIDKTREAIRTKRNQGYEYHTCVLNAFLLGLLISTGCRIEELCHLRIDIQARDLRTKRIIRLRAIDRKNLKDHDVLVQADFIPDDLLNEYLDRSRPWFMAGKPIESPSVRPCPHNRTDNEDARTALFHPWLLVSTSGRGYGCPEETADGEGRNKTAFASRCNQAGTRFKAQISLAALEAGMMLPGKRYEFGPHSVRGSCGYGVFLHHGRQKAAHYLGDEENTVAEFYSSINGIHVDSSCLIGIDIGPQLGTADPAATTPSLRRSALLRRLTQKLDRGELDVAGYLRAVQAAVAVRSPQPDGAA